MSKHHKFWNEEYKSGTHLQLSDEPADDLEKFSRWLERNYGRRFLNPLALALDLGCGNGRNLIYLAQQFAVRGVGYDISDVAIKQAEKASKDLPIKYAVRSISEPTELKEKSVTMVLDMMTSHFLKKAEREALRDEVLRVLKPGGWYFLKTFLAEEDQHVKRLLKEHPADEPNAYIHPRIGVYEYVWTEETIREFFEPYFTIHKIERSYKHITKDGKPWKRRTVVVYMEKPF